MVNPVDPNSNSPVNPANQAEQPKGVFRVEGEQKFLGMTFSATDWNKMMNIFLQQLCDYVNKTITKSTEKLKKDWARGRGEDPPE